MSNDSVAAFVKLGYWDAYRANVVLTARIFRVILWGIAAATLLAGAVFIIAIFHPSPGADWYEISRNLSPLAWLIVLSLGFVFLVPLLSARRITSDDRVKAGVHYNFTVHGIHIESSVAKADLQWAAIRQGVETQTLFLLFPNKNVAHIVPKRCLADTSEIETMRRLIRANVSRAKLHG